MAFDCFGVKQSERRVATPSLPLYKIAEVIVAQQEKLTQVLFLNIKLEFKYFDTKNLEIFLIAF